jgi:hypothetical protein
MARLGLSAAAKWPIEPTQHSGEPRQHFVERARHAHDSAAMKEHTRLILSLIAIANQGHGVLTDRIPGPINAGDQNKPGDALSLSRSHR